MRTDQARARLEAARAELTAIANDYFGAAQVIDQVELALANVNRALQQLPSSVDPGQLTLPIGGRS